MIWADVLTKVAVERDKQAFMTLYEYFAPRVFSYLKRLGLNEGQAEELTQETLYRLWVKADSIDLTRAMLSTWLFTVARNLFVDAKRRDAALGPPPFVDGHDFPFADVASPPSYAELEALDQRLHEAIERLPAQQAQMIRMSYFEAKSHRQIAEETGMAIGTVKSSIRLAMAKLRQSVRE